MTRTEAYSSFLVCLSTLFTNLQVAIWNPFYCTILAPISPVRPTSRVIDNCELQFLPIHMPGTPVLSGIIKRLRGNPQSL